MLSRGLGAGWLGLVRCLGLVGCLGLGGIAALGGCERPPALDDEAAPAAVATAVGSVPPVAPTPATPAETPVRIAFVGDISPSLELANRWLEGDARTQQEAFPFHQTRERLRSYDYLVGNLECVLSYRPVTRTDALSCPSLTARQLVTGGFDLVGLANNHAFDRGSLGYRDTVARLDEVGLAHVGHPSLEGEDPVHRVVLGGVRVALVAHHNRPTELAIDDVRRAHRGADVVIVFEHWGVDYAFEPVPFQRHRAGQLARAGAHAIVGSHPHVVHPEASLGGTLVAYSLGNFVFPAMNEPGTHLGALLELDLLPRGIVGHRYRAVHLDEQGLPRIAEETTELPTLPERPVPRLPLATIGTGSDQ